LVKKPLEDLLQLLSDVVFNLIGHSVKGKKKAPPILAELLLIFGEVTTKNARLLNPDKLLALLTN